MLRVTITTILAFGSLCFTGCKQSADQGADSSQPADQAVGRSSQDAAGTNAAQSSAVDNSRINQRDRNDEALTPGDQGESASDRELTRKIRRAVTQNDQLSTTAKNIKIITANGKVTLRGPVNTPAERDQIAALAQQIAGAGALDNQLEVKNTATTEERK
jgi:hyperosmotically inducible periplasmic protein